MCERCDDASHVPGQLNTNRRRLLFASAAGAAAAPLLGAASPAAAQATAPARRIPTTPFNVRAYGNTSKTAPVGPLTIKRRPVGPNDVLIDVLYCGICHSDIHQVKDEWHGIMTTQWPCVPGHEITGRVVAVGSAVRKFRVGDNCGVGCMVNSCGDCDNCKAGLEQHCLRGATYTYNVPDPVLGGHTLGGWAEQIVVPEKFVIRVSPGADLAATAPLLCAGVTTFSPLKRWNLGRDQRVGVVGLGGLGHIGLKLAVSKGADVTVFTTSPSKVADAKRLGARNVVLSTDANAMKAVAGQLDALLVTIPEGYSVAPYMGVLKTGGTLINIGSMMDLSDVSGAGLVFARKNIAGTLIGGLAETQQVVDYCFERNLKADIELIRPDQINAAFERVKGKNVKYRFVIDMKAAA